MLSDSGKCQEFAGKLVRQTEKAYCIDFGEGPVWVPQSQCEYAGKDTWLLTEWIAKEKGLMG